MGYAKALLTLPDGCRQMHTLIIRTVWDHFDVEYKVEGRWLIVTLGVHLPCCIKVCPLQIAALQQNPQ